MTENYRISDDLQKMMTNEIILWSGKPKKACFVLECIFNPMLIFAGIWFLIDFNFIGTLLFSNFREMGDGVWFILGFFAIHLMPVWLYLGGVVFSFLKLKHTEFAVTAHGVYITGGTFRKQYRYKSFAELNNAFIHRGIFDQGLGVGDVVFSNNNSDAFKIIDIQDYNQVCNLINMKRSEERVGYAKRNEAYDQPYVRPQQGFNPTVNTSFNANRTNQYQQNSYRPQPPQQNPTYNNTQNYQNSRYNQPYNSADYSSNPDFTGQNCDTHNGYEVNSGSYDYDIWDDPKSKREKDSWEL